MLPFHDGRVGTILTLRAHADTQELDDPRVSEGLRITLEALGRAAARCADRCRLVVVVIPTKELVFAERLRETGATAPAAFERLVANEREVRERLGRFLVGAGIAWIDTLAVLRAAVEAGDNPYPADWNAHPNARGNDAIARGVATSLAATTAPDPQSRR